MVKYEIYGYAIESYNESICPNTKNDCGYWDRYNKKIMIMKNLQKKHGKKIHINIVKADL